MARSLLSIFLLVSQVYLVLRGREIFGKELNPYLLFIVSIILCLLFFFTINNKKLRHENLPFKLPKALIGFILGTCSIIVSFSFVRAIFHQYADFAAYSDVIPQLQTQYERFTKGILPYAPVEQFGWQPFPVYMPLHWLPLAIPTTLGIDVRWIGMGFLAAATGIWGAYVWMTQASRVKKFIATILPSLGLWGFVYWDNQSFAAVLESLIAAYFLVLATGLASKNLALTVTGIILCLLSRYTIVFWLPLFMILLWLNASKRKNLIAWCSIAASVLILYIIPFWLKDPSIFIKGLAYHNHCAVDEWRGFGEERTSWTFEIGIYFGKHMRDLFPGDVAHKVLLGRIVQAVLMLLLLILGLFIYRKKKMNFYDLSLGMLYLFVLFFYLFGVLTYIYYYLPLFMITAVLCGKICLYSLRK
jgi:hypothetical protein